MDKGETDISGESINSTQSSSKMDAEAADENNTEKLSTSSLVRIPVDYYGAYGVRVCNIGDSITEVDIKELFSDVGRVLRINMHTTSMKIPMAFVKFPTEEEARSAIEKYDGYVFKGTKLHCSPAYASRLYRKEKTFEKFGNYAERKSTTRRNTDDRDTSRSRKAENSAKEPLLTHCKNFKQQSPKLKYSPEKTFVRKSESDGLLTTCNESDGAVSRHQTASLTSQPDLNQESDHSYEEYDNGYIYPLNQKMTNLHIETNGVGTKNVHFWTVHDVVSYFRGTECSEFADFFGIEEIDGSALLLLDRATLCEHMKLGPALKIVNIINKLKTGEY